MSDPIMSNRIVSNTSRFPEIAHLLVTEDNPPTSIDRLDYARCAGLHNFLVRYAWAADSRSLETFQPTTFFNIYGDEAIEICEFLHSDVISFLEAAYDTTDLSLFYWVEGVASPERMFFWNKEAYGDEFVTLYSTNPTMVEHGNGLVYDQVRHRATVSLSIWEQDGVLPPEEHRDLWHPLETILSNWIEMIGIGKVTTTHIPEEQRPETRPWVWQPYSEQQVESTLAALNSLVEAIESRMPDSTARVSPAPFTDSELDTISIPCPCFIRSFLSRMRVPDFKFIAPGLLVPQHDRAAFLGNQRFTNVNTSTEEEEFNAAFIPPVLVFPTEKHETVDFDIESNPPSLHTFCAPYTRDIKRGNHSIPAGLYSESVERSGMDYAEEGFRLLLPFAIESGSNNARKSSGEVLEEGIVAGLFQHGFYPFGADMIRAQRMERLFDKWTELVERGIWEVGNEGVVGGIETFKDADGDRWKDYIIPPSW